MSSKCIGEIGNQELELAWLLKYTLDFAQEVVIFCISIQAVLGIKMDIEIPF